MAILDGSIRQNKNSLVRREKEQRREDIKDLIELLKEEEIQNPELGRNYRRLAKCWNEKWLQTGNGATDARRDYSEKAMKAARDKLDLDLICVGAVMLTLKWLCGLECR